MPVALKVELVCDKCGVVAPSVLSLPTGDLQNVRPEFTPEPPGWVLPHADTGRTRLLTDEEVILYGTHYRKGVYEVLCGDCK